jgi:signal transduction histidine kinase
LLSPDGSQGTTYRTGQLISFGEISARGLVDGNTVTASVGIIRDITERIEAEKDRQNLERQLFYTQRMKALGTLAGGFAHNFNNLLVPVIGYIDMVLTDMEKDNLHHEHLKKALESANKAKQMILQVQAYAQSDNAHKVMPIDICDTVDAAIRVFKPSLSRKIELSVNKRSDCPIMHADPYQIQQMVINLLVNANEAILADTGNGSISVTVNSDEIGNTPPNTDIPVQPGRYIQISITDTGCGIDPEIIHKIFDPFHTTKFEPGKGLGLSLSHRIARKYGGEIIVQSSVGEGSMFNIYLPIIKREAAED